MAAHIRKYAEICRNRLPGDIAYTSFTVSPYFFLIHLRQHICENTVATTSNEYIPLIHTHHILGFTAKGYLRTKLGTEESSLSLTQSNMQPAAPSPKHPRTYQNTFLQSLSSSFPGCR